MSHRIFGRKLGRNTDERRRLFMVLSRDLIAKGRIKTTFAKAKAVQPLIEKLITHAKKATSSSLAQVSKTLADNKAMKDLVQMAGVRFEARNSGYTRIVKLGPRRGDGAQEVFIEFVDALSKPEPVQNKKKATKVEEAVVVPKTAKKRT